MLSNDIHDIACIEFGVYSPEEIRKMAVCKIDNPKSSGPNTVYDPRMGYDIGSSEPCVTCGLKSECWGHFGYIDLNEPVLHPMYYKSIATLLKCFCKQCNRLLLTEDQIELSGLIKLKGERRYNKILERIEKIDICSHCSSPQPKIIFKSKDNNIIMEFKGGKGESKISIIMEVDDIKKIFDNIPDRDVELLGFDPSRIHPKNLILTVLPVIPPQSRPCVMSDGKICDDDLTYSLTEIIKVNNSLNDLRGSKDFEQTVNVMRFKISTMFNNSKGKSKRPTDYRPLKGLKERLAGKKGRLRDNLMGKRVNQSARTVIGAEPTLKLQQVGIPNEVAKIHTKPEVVTPFNIDWLSELVNNGKANFLTTFKRRLDENGHEIGPPIKTRLNLQIAMSRKGLELLYGDIIVRGDLEFKTDKQGKIVIPKKLGNTKLIKVISGKEKMKEGDRLIRDGQFVDLKVPPKKNFSLKIGDIVERQLQKGDVALFNRQPTLHKGSMLAVEVVPMKAKTFRFNVAQAKSYNADYDGDEMNLHAPQSYETEAELRYIASTPLNVITPQESKPIITITQDSLVAAYLMTRRNPTLSRSEFTNICSSGETHDGKNIFDPSRIKHIEKVLKQKGKKPEVFNSRGLLSLIMPITFNYEKKNGTHPEEPIVKICQGVFVEGALDKSTLGSAHGSIIQLINNEYGPIITGNFIDNMQFIANAWLLLHGFSIGLEDCMITSEESVMAIKDKLTECYTKAEGIEETTQNPGIREIRVTSVLSQAKDVGMKIAKDAMKPDNNFLVTVSSGAKGDYFNIAQITGLLGQQNLENKRVSPMLSHGKRTLPHYPFDSLSKEREYESRGFIRHSFIHGLTPHEFFFHAMSGREGVADTAMGTSKSGYIQRKIIKVCEDIQVRYDQTVRDFTGKIYQFCYGENGYDPCKTIKLKDQPVPCDINRLVAKLNNSYELGTTIDRGDKKEPSIKFEIIKEEKERNEKEEKKLLIAAIKQLQPGVAVNRGWTIEELETKLEEIKMEIERDEEGHEETEEEEGQEETDDEGQETDNEEDEEEETEDEDFIDESEPEIEEEEEYFSDYED